MRPKEEVPTSEEAHAKIDALVHEEYLKWRDYEARRRFINPAIQRNAEIDKEARREAAAKRKAAELAKQARKAWRKVYGESIADQLDAGTRYWLVTSRAGNFLFSDREQARAAHSQLVTGGIGAELKGAGGRRLNARAYTAGGQNELELDPGIAGVELARFADSLAEVDPSAEALGKLVQERARVRERRVRERAKQEAAERQAQRERRLLGVTVSDVPDE